MAVSTPHEKEVPASEECWALLDRIAAGSQLRRAPRLREFLLYVSRRSLEDGRGQVHEQEIGVDVFGRSDTYDTSVDNIVRANATELRKRIEGYFNSEGSHETVIMEIPRGSYIPVFRYRSIEPEIAANVQSDIRTPNLDSPEAIPKGLQVSERRSLSGRIAIGLLIFVLAVGCAFFWSQNRALHRSFYAWQYKPSVAALWSDILNANPDTDVVISDTSIGLAQAISHRTFSLSEYLSRSYISELQESDLSPDTHAALDRILAWNLANPDEFKLANRILALDPLGKGVHLYDAHNYMPDLIKRDNVILIGARKSNPWAELFDSRINFIPEFDVPRVVNRAPVAGELQTYVSSGGVGYCVVAYLPAQTHNGIVLLVEGTNAEATEAAGDFLLSEEQLSNFKKKLNVKKLPFFEVLLKVSSVRGTPLAATIEAFRTYPNL